MQNLKKFFITAVFSILVSGSLFYTNSAMAAEKADAYEKTDIGTKLVSSEFICTNPNVNMKYYDNGNGVMIKGTKDDITGAKYEFTEAFDFGSNVPDYLVIDGLSQRKQNVSLEFYLDDADTPFVTTSMIKQSREKKWNKSQNKCIDIKANNITGTHKLSFKIVTDNDKDMEVLFRYILFIRSDIPTINFDIDEAQGSIAAMNGDSEHQTECYGKMTIAIPDGYKSEYSEEALATQTYELDYIRGRGNSTWGADKKPYKIKLDKKADLLGMGKNKHWVLLANYYDITMLRNKITYWLGEQLGMEFTPKCEFVNVVMNNRYLGSYYLSEQIRVGESRVNIDDLEDSKDASDEATISGGYLLSMFPYEPVSGQSIRTKKGQEFCIESPEFYDYFNEAQFNYISNYMQNTEDAIYSPTFKDKNGIPYTDYMDIDAAVDYYWVQEFSLNGDAFGSGSTYLYKKRNGKLYWGPLWDFDYVAWGATEYTGNSVEGYMCNTSTWFEGLFKDPEFCKKVIERWPAIKEKLMEAAKDGGQIDKYSERQYQSQKANYQLLTKFSDTYSDGGWEDGSTNIDKVTYDSEKERLKLWIRERIDWIDNNLSELKTEYYTLTFKINDKVYASIQCSSKGGVNLPAEPVKKGYVFKGWFANANDGNETYEVQITEYSSINQDMTAYPKWEKESGANKLSKIVLGAKDYYVFEDDELYIKAYTIPFNVSMPELTWSSSDETVAKPLGDGLIRVYNKKETAVITVKAKNGMTAKCNVHVVSWRDMQDPEDLTISSENLEITQGKYKQIVAQSVPLITYAKPDSIIFESTNSDIVQVNGNGYVYAKNPGTAYIVVYSTFPEKMKTCKVTVKLDAKKNNTFTWKNANYKITAVGKKAAVKFTGTNDTTKTKLTIGSSIKVSGTKYNITAIDTNAFKNYTKLKKVTINNKNISKANKKKLKNKYKQIKFIFNS